MTELRTRILYSANTYSVSGTTYYVSPNGSDGNDGKSISSPRKTLKGLNLSSGDAVLFERNGIYRLTEGITAVSGVTYGAYGSGNKPAIYGSPANFANSSWAQQTDNIWYVDFNSNDVGGVIFNNGNEFGTMRASVGALAQNGDFYFDKSSSRVYLYCTLNPAQYYKSIEISADIVLFTIPVRATDIIIDNLCLKYAGGFAVSAQSLNKNIKVTNCEIGFIGGRHMSENLRYGNAIEFWNGAQNIKVENNWIYQTFDSAISWQGNNGSTYSGISFSNNLLEYNNADIEFFDSGAKVNGFAMNNNIMRYTSAGWGTKASIRGIEGCIRANTEKVTLNNVSFMNNIIEYPARQIINWELGANQLEKITRSGNCVFVKGSLRTSNVVIQGVKPGATGDTNSATAISHLRNAFALFDSNASLSWVA